MTDDRKAETARKARERAQRWRDKVMSDPETAAKAKADHARRCRESRARKALDAGRPPRGVGRPKKAPPTPEEIEAKRVKIRARLARWMAKPGVRDRVKATSAAWRAANPEKYRAAKRRYRQAHPEQLEAYNLRRRVVGPHRVRLPDAYAFAGSVLEASAASPARDLLAQVTALVPRWHLERDEVIAEAMLLLLEGAEPAEAVAKAKATVARSFRFSLLSVPVDECHWL